MHDDAHRFYEATTNLPKFGNGIGKALCRLANSPLSPTLVLNIESNFTSRRIGD